MAKAKKPNWPPHNFRQIRPFTKRKGSRTMATRRSRRQLTNILNPLTRSYRHPQYMVTETFKTILSNPSCTCDSKI